MHGAAECIRGLQWLQAAIGHQFVKENSQLLNPLFFSLCFCCLLLCWSVLLSWWLGLEKAVQEGCLSSSIVGLGSRGLGEAWHVDWVRKELSPLMKDDWWGWGGHIVNDLYNHVNCNNRDKINCCG